MANINSWLTENRLLAGRKEVYDSGENYYSSGADYGTAVSTVDNEDANVRVRELSLGSLTVEFDDESSKYATGDHTRDEAIAGITQGTIDFNMKLAPGQLYAPVADFITSATEVTVSDPTYTATSADYDISNIGLPYKKYLEGAGLKSQYTEAKMTYDGVDVHIVQNGFWEFYPTTDKDLETLTMVIQDKASVKDKDSKDLYGIQYKIAGAMSTLTIESESAGKPFKMNFSYTGKVDSVYEVADYAATSATDTLLDYEDKYSLSTIANKMLYTYITLQELDHGGAPIAGNEINFCVNKFSLDTGLTISPFQCQMDGSGVKYNAVTSRDPRITIDPLLERVGPANSTVVSKDWFKFWEAINSETTYSLQIRVFDGDPGSNWDGAQELFAIAAPRVQTLSPNISDSDGYFRNELTFRPLRNIYHATSGANDVQADYKIRIYGESKVIV